MPVGVVQAILDRIISIQHRDIEFARGHGEQRYHIALIGDPAARGGLT